MHAPYLTHPPKGGFTVTDSRSFSLHSGVAMHFYSFDLSYNIRRGGKSQSLSARFTTKIPSRAVDPGRNVLLFQIYSGTPQRMGARK